MRIQCQTRQQAAKNLFARAKTSLVIGLHRAPDATLKELGLPTNVVDAICERSRLEGFVGSDKQQIALRLDSSMHGVAEGATVFLLGLGRKQNMAPPDWLRAAGTAARLARGVRAQHIDLLLPELNAESPVLGHALLVAQGLHLGLYRFTACRTAGKEDDATAAPSPLSATVWLGSADDELLTDCQEALEVGAIIAEAVAMARDWVNLPANLLGPEELADRAIELAKTSGLECRVLEAKELRAEKMGLLLGVGQGSVRPPRLVHLSYRPKEQKGQRPLVLVGKGILFDSGGLCIKPCESMSTMKMDMGGAAAVLATIAAVARLGLPVHVHAMLALAENMPSGHAIRPGDILTSMQGTTVEVNNTDAEGRLVLADAITYARRLEPAALVDVATLTGACMVALGPKTAGLFARDEALGVELIQSAAEAGEDLWRLPLTDGLRDQLKSDCADMRNTGDRYGGAITAALFLQAFVGEVAWAHLDIAGPAWGGEERGHMSKGGSGFAVATLVRWLMRRSHNSEPEQAAGEPSAKGLRRGRTKGAPATAVRRQRRTQRPERRG